MISYPLLFATANQQLKVGSRKELIAKYDQIITAELKTFLIQQEPECISRVGAKGFTIGQGQLWFDKFPDGKVRIFTINCVFYPEQ